MDLKGSCEGANTGRRPQGALAGTGARSRKPESESKRESLLELEAFQGGIRMHVN